MERNPYAPLSDDLPDIIPVFPLAGVLLLPSGELPLNIFEPRYLEMLDHALAGNRLIGMVQSKSGLAEKSELYKMGCIGKITKFSETLDGRYEVTLTGISRFTILEELSVTTPYRQVRAEWSKFEEDVSVAGCLGLDRKRLIEMLGTYFSKKSLRCDWSKIQEASDDRLITCLSMVCPFTPEEKQVLLEADCCKSRAKIFMTMLEMALHDADVECGCH